MRFSVSTKRLMIASLIKSSVDLNSGIHLSLNKLLDQIVEQYENELEELVQTGVIDVALTKEFVGENISMLLPVHNKCMK